MLVSFTCVVPIMTSTLSTNITPGAVSITTRVIVDTSAQRVGGGVQRWHSVSFCNSFSVPETAPCVTFTPANSGMSTGCNTPSVIVPFTTNINWFGCNTYVNAGSHHSVVESTFIVELSVVVFTSRKAGLTKLIFFLPAIISCTTTTACSCLVFSSLYLAVP